jgi:hypothetical protein
MPKFLRGTQILPRLGLNRSNLLPVSMSRASTLLELPRYASQADHQMGDVLTTKQMVYITDASDKLFLSREACMALKIIGTTFPTVGECLTTGDSDDEARPCDCPPRSKPPPRPTALPFPATTDNRERLQQWLLDCYASSTFNTCTHTSLPIM